MPLFTIKTSEDARKFLIDALSSPSIDWTGLPFQFLGFLKEYAPPEELQTFNGLSNEILSLTMEYEADAAKLAKLKIDGRAESWRDLEKKHEATTTKLFELKKQWESMFLPMYENAYSLFADDLTAGKGGNITIEAGKALQAYDSTRFFKTIVDLGEEINDILMFVADNENKSDEKAVATVLSLLSAERAAIFKNLATMAAFAVELYMYPFFHAAEIYAIRNAKHTDTEKRFAQIIKSLQDKSKERIAKMFTATHWLNDFEANSAAFGKTETTQYINRIIANITREDIAAAVLAGASENQSEYAAACDAIRAFVAPLFYKWEELNAAEAANKQKSTEQYRAGFDRVIATKAAKLFPKSAGDTLAPVPQTPLTHTGKTITNVSNIFRNLFSSTTQDGTVDVRKQEPRTTLNYKCFRYETTDGKTGDVAFYTFGEFSGVCVTALMNYYYDSSNVRGLEDLKNLPYDAKETAKINITARSIYEKMTGRNDFRNSMVGEIDEEINQLSNATLMVDVTDFFKENSAFRSIIPALQKMGVRTRTITTNDEDGFEHTEIRYILEEKMLYASKNNITNADGSISPGYTILDEMLINKLARAVNQLSISSYEEALPEDVQATQHALLINMYLHEKIEWIKTKWKDLAAENQEITRKNNSRIRAAERNAQKNKQAPAAVQTTPLKTWNVSDGRIKLDNLYQAVTGTAEPDKDTRNRIRKTMRAMLEQWTKDGYIYSWDFESYNATIDDNNTQRFDYCAVVIYPAKECK